MKRYPQGQGWWQDLISFFKGYPAWLVELGFAAILGFLTGFLVKNFGKYLLFIVVTLIVSGYLLSYFNLATFDFIQIKKFFGIVEIPSFDRLFQVLTTWARNNTAICVGAIVGFMLGWSIAK
jgi:uncharacterized membrane protein (Fun14 family)